MDGKLARALFPAESDGMGIIYATALSGVVDGCVKTAEYDVPVPSAAEVQAGSRVVMLAQGSTRVIVGMLRESAPRSDVPYDAFIDLAADPSISTVRSGNWRYKRFQSGQQFAWYTSAEALTFPYGQIPFFYTAPLSIDMSTVGFTSVENVHMSALGTGALLLATSTGYSTASISHYVIRVLAQTSLSAQVQAFVIGRWS